MGSGRNWRLPGAVRRYLPLAVGTIITVVLIMFIAPGSRAHELWYLAGALTGICVLILVVRPSNR